ncbi:MAG TPA: hypothetical protein VHR45_12555 [Thermoanaerobaculia bacterium]|nr:hypothetical protein [Thermoanaerobaculia bacterium]
MAAPERFCAGSYLLLAVSALGLTAPSAALAATAAALTATSATERPLSWRQLSGAEAAQPAETPPPAPAGEEAAAGGLVPHLKFGLEVKANFRQSEDNRFAVPFPFTPDQLPVGQTRGFEETVNPGSHLEVSNLTLLGDARWGEAVKAHLKVDFINLYYRNPTSTDKKFEVSEVWLLFGRQTLPAMSAKGSGLYVKAGKFPKFERQNDRHLESYGLVSTAFNRFEDVGAEVGIDLGRNVYLKVSETAGNPVFLRDPNALAGDNGTPVLLQSHPNPTLHTGIDILYDTHVNDYNLGHPQLGAGVGLRLGDETGRNGIDLLVWGRRRSLADKLELEGTFYGGDLEIFNTPIPGHTSLPITNRRKQEAGGNLWLYLGDLSLFGQFVDQKLAGLPRRGYEGELAYRFELPLALAVGGQQLFSFIAPAVRYSRLDNRFKNSLPTPAPSFAWNWYKLDGGLRVGVLAGIDLTLEYADNTFTLGSGAKAHDNEFLTTLRWRV